MKQNILIIGGGYAGLLACNRLVKLKKDLEITLINDGEVFVERIRNHEIAAGRTLPEYSITGLLHPEVRLINDKVTILEPKHQYVRTLKNKLQLKYDYLIYALGSNAARDTTLRPNVITKESSLKIYKLFQDNQKGKVWVVGAGLTGIELVSELAETYPKWQFGIVTRDHFASSFSQKGRSYLREIFDQQKIEIRENTEIENFTEGVVSFKDGSKSNGLFILDSTGFASSDLGNKSGLRCNQINQIYINEYLQVPEHSNIFVAGDACLLNSSALRMGCVTAMPLGIHAADNLIKLIDKEALTPFAFRFTGRCVSLGRKLGLIQFTDEKDNPIEKIITGRFAAFIKEMICKYTLLSIRLERSLPFRTYRWPKSKINLSKNLFEESYE